MPLVPYADPAVLTDEQAALTEQIAAGRRHGLPNLYRLLLQAPHLAQGWVGLANGVRFESQLPARTRELVALRTAIAADCTYARHHHSAAGRSAGLTDDEIDALASWPASPLFEAEEGLALELADAVVERRPVASGVAERAVQALGVSAVTEIVITAAYYLAVAGFAAAMELDIET